MHREGIGLKGTLGFICDRDLFLLLIFFCALSTLQLEMATTVFEKLVVSYCSNNFSKKVLVSPILLCFKQGLVRVGFVFFVESCWQRNTV